MGNRRRAGWVGVGEGEEEENWGGREGRGVARVGGRLGRSGCRRRGGGG